jgi:hypothetical protein
MICVHLYTQTVVVTASARRASPMSKAVHPLRLTKTRHVEYHRRNTTTVDCPLCVWNGGTVSPRRSSVVAQIADHASVGAFVLEHAIQDGTVADCCRARRAESRLSADGAL